MTGITSQRWQKGLCIKCGKQKEMETIPCGVRIVQK